MSPYARKLRKKFSPVQLFFFFNANVGSWAIGRTKSFKSVFNFLGRFRKAANGFVISLCPSVRVPVRSHGTTQLPRDGFS